MLVGGSAAVACMRRLACGARNNSVHFRLHQAPGPSTADRPQGWRVCAAQVFKEVVVGSKLAGDAGLKSWHDCLDIGKADGTDKIPLLDEELKAQTGSDTESTIAIMPTVRVNGKQYRGTLDGPSVLRAVCSGFPTGMEPTVCNEEWVSDNECKVGGEGWNACNSG